jgi:hypothetical protein
LRQQAVSGSSVFGGLTKKVNAHRFPSSIPPA